MSSVSCCRSLEQFSHRFKLLTVESPPPSAGWLDTHVSPVAVINGSWVTLARAAWTAWLNEDVPAAAVESIITPKEMKNCSLVTENDYSRRLIISRKCIAAKTTILDLCSKGIYPWNSWYFCMSIWLAISEELPRCPVKNFFVKLESTCGCSMPTRWLDVLVEKAVWSSVEWRIVDIIVRYSIVRKR